MIRLVTHYLALFEGRPIDARVYLIAKFSSLAAKRINQFAKWVTTRRLKERANPSRSEQCLQVVVTLLSGVEVENCAYLRRTEEKKMESGWRGTRRSSRLISTCFRDWPLCGVVVVVAGNVVASRWLC